MPALTEFRDKPGPRHRGTALGAGPAAWARAPSARPRAGWTREPQDRPPADAAAPEGCKTVES